MPSLRFLKLTAAALLLAAVATIDSADTHPPTPPCPVSCAYNHHFNGCGVMTHLANGSTAFVCPPSVVFSVGFDSDMVLQRDAITAVYGQLLSTNSETARVEVTVTDEKGQSYTSGAAQLSEAQNYCLPAAGTHACPGEGAAECCIANYTTAWKAYLRPAPAGGHYTITARCTEGCTGDRQRDRTTLERVTMGGAAPPCAGLLEPAQGSLAAACVRQMFTSARARATWLYSAR